MAFLKFPDKDPQEILDYTVDFSDLIAAAAGTEIASATVEIEEISPAESPVDLVLNSPAVILSALGGESVSPLPVDGATVWLSNGTLDSKYTLKFTAIDTNASPNPRTYVRRATLKIKQK